MVIQRLGSQTNTDSCPCHSKYNIKMCLIYNCSHYWLEWCFFLSTKHCLSKHCLTISWRSLHPAGVYANEWCWLQYTKALQINLLRFLWIKGIISPKECEISGEKNNNFFEPSMEILATEITSNENIRCFWRQQCQFLCCSNMPLNPYFDNILGSCLLSPSISIRA